jgi:lipoprotein NlpI
MFHATLALVALIPAQADADAALKQSVAQLAKRADADPANVQLRVALGRGYLRLRENEKAADAFTAALKLDPKSVSAYDGRGDAYLKLGRFKQSVADFDRVLQLRPDIAPEHWRRGIALYYAGRYADGVKQFETHKTANPEDVENAVWHYLCNVKVTDPATARKQLIAVTKDRRVPMAEIQKLFAGKATPADVTAAAEKVPATTPAGTEARFYAHLYLALYAEAAGDAKGVRDHLTPAVKKYKIGHYMWDVANAHLAMLKKKDGK